MKRTCRLILGILLVGGAIVPFAEPILPVSNAAVLKVSRVAYVLGLIAAVAGMVLGSIFLSLRRFRAQGIVFPLLTFAVSACFAIIFLVVPLSTALRMMNGLGPDFLSPGTRVVVFHPDAPGRGVAILDTRSQRWTADMGSGTCTIRDLTAQVMLAEYIIIRRTPNGHKVEMVAHRVQEDSAPFHRKVNSSARDGTAVFETSSWSAPPTERIRINGQTMPLGEAADRFPRIPPALITKP